MQENEKHGGCKPEKLSPNEKIDPISALVSAWHRMLASPLTGPTRVWFLDDTGGVRVPDGVGGLKPWKSSSGEAGEERR